MRRKPFAAAVLVVVSWTCYSISLADRSVQQLFQDSILVVRASVNAINGQCGPRYCIFRATLAVSSVEKGAHDLNAPLEVCSFPQLHLGQSYYLFIRTGEPSIDGTVPCSLDVPHDGAFSEFGERSYRFSSPDTSLVIKHQDDVVQVTAKLEPTFSRDLESAKLNSEGMTPGSLPDQ